MNCNKKTTLTVYLSASMYCNTIFLRSNMTLVLAILFFISQIQSGLGMSLQHTGVAGDPAPGRSPGPPPIQPGIMIPEQANGDLRPTVIVTADEDKKVIDCNFNEPVEKAKTGEFNFTIMHHLFRTDLGLVEGIHYQAALFNNGADQNEIREYTLTSFIIFTSVTSGDVATAKDNGNHNYSEVKEVRAGQFRRHEYQRSSSCSPSTVKGRLLGQAYVLVNWTLPISNIDQPNVTFRLHYKTAEHKRIFEMNFTFPIRKDCELHLHPAKANLSWTDLPPRTYDCQILFPVQAEHHGLVVDLNRLNVPCASGGYLQFFSKNTTVHQHYRAIHRQTHLCGKLEELQEADRHIYFASSNLPLLLIHGSPVFSLNYRLVDFCYNVTLVSRNGSFDLKPTSSLECTFRIHLPYGNRVALRLQMGPINNNIQQQQHNSGQEVVEPFFVKKDDSPINCVGLSMRLYDGIAVWSHCAKSENPQRNVEVVSRENYVALKVNVDKSDSRVALKVWYRAEPIPEVVQQCAFGWVAIRQFCVSAIEDVKMPWNQAEMECVRRGGHLASVRSEHAQEIIDNLLLNSPGYRDHNAYWIGASDKTYEGDFRWSDGLPFSYSNWFPGWSQHGHYNRQPNDDGLSEQDCVEVRRVYHLPSASSRIAASFHWNDRDCSTPNYFLCERLLTDEPVEDAWPPECNQSVILSRKHPRATVTSPGFPRPYPDNAECDTEVIAPPGYHLVIDFDELVLEKEPSECSYDYLEIIETGIPPTSSTNATHIVSNVLPTATAALSSTTTVTSSGPQTPRRLCGDWSAKLKLLRYVSQGSKLRLRFVSDYSHHFGGYKARVSMESAMECADDRLHMFNHSCYLFVSYPEVTWPTAQQICKGLKAQLASIGTPEEERFVTSNIRRSAEYSTSAIYWLGGKLTPGGKHEWMDGGPNSYSGWLPGHNPEDNEVSETPSNNPMCLGIQWMSSPTPMLPSGLYWQSQKCSTVGGYICKRRTQISGSSLNFNKTLNGSEGRLTSPNYPGNYYNNLNYWIKIVGPERSRLVIQFSKIDIEQQVECLYDYVELKSEPRNGNDLSNDNTARWCGTHDTDMEKFNFVSETNEVTLRFHSDYSISGNGFSMIWQAIDVSACPLQTLTSREGTITSPNYPNFMLQRLDCSITILAPSGRRIWLEITDYNIGSEHNDNIIENGGSNDEALLELDLNGDGNGKPFRPFQVRGHLTDGAFVSTGEKLQVRLRTSEKPVGGGFKATYKTINSDLKEERIIDLTNITYGTILHLNYPNRAPSNVDYIQHFVAPLGYTILLELYQVKFSDKECPFEAGFVEVFDNYADKNGTKWFLCENREDDDSLIPPAPLSITSYYNTIHMRQKSARIGVSLNGTLRVQPDLNYKVKLLRNEENSVESCTPNPCHNAGKCVGNGARNKCQCSGHFTGMFCALTMCELQPCLFGQCELTAIGYRCHCQAGYAGTTCEQRQKPCESNPCDGRGQCVERGDTFHCRCHAWWEGARCERRMQRIPFKPLSERMLHEPFWLGLITVTVVLGFIGLVWCAKRHFPEKLEKLLAEEADRNRSGSSIRGSSIREQLSSSGSGGATAVMVVPSPQQGCPRSLFGRLGIRKPSLLSLTSPHTGGSNSHHHHPSAAATARTFSLDDLLKPPPRRTPSPRKKRNNSTPTKKNAAEKKQILQQLISPAASHQKPRKVSLGELIQLSERKLKDAEANAEKGDGTKETSFGGINPRTSGGSSPPIDDPKLEKKVTFARLLNKVSAEMSSGSEIELGMMNPHENRLRLTPKAASTPPSPATDVRSPHSTSSNQGSDSMSSLDVSLPCGTGSITDLLQSRRSGKLISGKPVKPASADSILAMFRNFSSTSAGANLSASTLQSPSTTPTASSPQDEAAGDDDSSTSSIHTPLSFSSGPPDSPIMQWSSHSIEVPVLDPLSAHRNQNIPSSNLLQPPTILLELPSNVSKCLSPIRELPTPLPTPLPSPAPTPMRQRSPVFSSNEDLAMDMSDDRISIEIPGMSISTSEGDADDLVQDIAIDPQAEDGLLQEEAAAMSQTCGGSMFRLKPRPPPVGQGVTAVTITDLSKQAPSSPSNTALSSASLPPPPLVIPTLIIQQPSPTRRSPPTLIFPGSPPPQRASSSSHETHFPFPGPGTTINSGGKPRRGLLKEFDKPTSLDLPNAPPMITITCNLSEAESDAESISPAAKPTNQHLGVATGTVGMCYLSPFSMCSRADRTASESNLSSSGYSSMASPGPSRCGSNNPLCPSEMEDPGPPGSGPTNLHSQQMAPRRPSPLLKTTTTDSTEGGNVDGSTTDQGHCRGRSDSETLSDDPLIESNDEGIGTDHIDEKIEEGELKSAKELEVFIGKDFLDNGKTLLDLPVINTSPSLNVNNKCGSLESDIDKLLPRPTVTMSSLQLPSIVVQTTDNLSGGVSVGCDKHLSPVSSRSESPLSDKTIGSHFSPQFYGRHKDQLPFTDSDGLYDFPSSDPAQSSRLSPSVTVQHRKSTGRRREKRPSKTVLKTPSPTKNSPLHNLLDVPGKDVVHCRVPTPRKPSPKRRAARAQLVSSSSSSESLNSSSIKDPSRVTSSSPSPDSIRWPSVGDWQNDKRKGRKIPAEVSGEDVGEDATSAMIPKMVRHEDMPLKPHKRISKLRTISHQIRFLRRLELSLKRRERLVSLSDSVDSDGGDDGEESPRASSPLLQPPSRGNAKPELMHKSSSIGRLGGGGSHHSSRTKLKLAGVKNKKSGSQMFIPQDDTRLWTKVPMSE